MKDHISSPPASKPAAIKHRNLPPSAAVNVTSPYQLRRILKPESSESPKSERLVSSSSSPSPPSQPLDYSAAKSRVKEVIGSSKVKKILVVKSDEEGAESERPRLRPVVEQRAPLRLRRSGDAARRSTEDGERRLHELAEKLDLRESVIKELRLEVAGIRAELGEALALNSELQKHNKALHGELEAAKLQIESLRRSHDQVQVRQQSTQASQIADQIKNMKDRNEVTKGLIVTSETTMDRQKDVSANVVAPPPPPLPPRPLARPASNPKAPSVVELYRTLSKPEVKKEAAVGNSSKGAGNNVHNSIVGEIQNRSLHLMAIKVDIETKGDFINGLVRKVLSADYSDIEDVLQFVDWLDNELSSLADERAVLKHFPWPEKKADAMREAAIEYRDLKLLANEISSYKIDVKSSCENSLKRMAGLLDKSERSTQRLIRLRNSVMVAYRDYRIPTDWMLDSGIVKKIKEASMKLANMYMKRVMLELHTMRSSEREHAQEALLLQGVHFAYRAHQFAGGLDSETLCAFEELRKNIPGHLLGSKELQSSILSS